MPPAGPEATRRTGRPRLVPALLAGAVVAAAAVAVSVAVPGRGGGVGVHVVDAGVGPVHPILLVSGDDVVGEDEQDDTAHVVFRDGDGRIVAGYTAGSAATESPLEPGEPMPRRVVAPFTVPDPATVEVYPEPGP